MRPRLSKSLTGREAIRGLGGAEASALRAPLSVSCSRSTKNLALSRDRKYHPYVPRFAKTWLRTSDVSTNKSQSRFYAQRLRVLRHTRQHMTAISPPSLFLAPHIVEPGPSAILAGLPLGGVTASEISTRRTGVAPVHLPFGGVAPNGSFSRSKRVRGSRGPGLEGLLPQLRFDHRKRVQNYKFYGACPKNETCAFSGRLTHHCTVAGGVGYEKILDWPPWKEPLPRRSWLTTA